MSRIGKKFIAIPKEVKVELSNATISVTGGKGKLSRLLPAGLEIEIKDGQLRVKGNFKRKLTREQAGLAIALINNMIKGVTDGYSKELEVIGVGYRVQAQGKNLNMQLRFSHPVIYPVPEDIEIKTPKPTQILIQGIDKQRVGDVAAGIRAVFPPEPYKGTGIRYKGEFVRKKIGKAITK
ncbi:50S ribosomal protein L6 [Candidatus Omnitrophota bacterium]